MLKRKPIFIGILLFGFSPRVCLTEPSNLVFSLGYLVSNGRRVLLGGIKLGGSATHTPRQSLSSYFVLKSNNHGEVVVKYVGKETNIFLNTSIWVPKILVTNMQGPKSSWGPKSRN